MSDGSTSEMAGVRQSPLANQITEFLNFCKIEKGLAVNSISAYGADLDASTSIVAFIRPGMTQIRYGSI